MQFSSRSCALLVLFALSAVPVHSLSAVSQARLFMRSHVRAPPSGDELAELKTENPEAYALVKALLTKRSLGLLDPRHPTSKFAAAPTETVEQGPEAFAKFASTETVQAPHQEVQNSQPSVPYAEVQGAAHHDWLNWKPQDSAASDEAMVQNVLGAVAELKGKKVNLMSQHRSTPTESQPTTEEQPASSEAPAQTAKVAQKVSQPDTAPRENSYLKTVDFGLSTPEAPKAAPQPKHKNSYLDGIDLSGDMPQVTESSQKPKQTSQAQRSSSNYLTSFSWDDSQPRAQRAQDQPQPKKEEAIPVNSKDANLLSWLGVVSKEPVHQSAPAAPAAPAKPSNPYLADLS